MMADLSSQQQAAALVLGGLTTLCISANALIGVYQKFASIRAMRQPARMPPFEEDAAKTFATKSEVIALRKEWRQHCSESHRRLDATLSEIFGLLRAAESRNNDWQRGVATQLGHIHEGLDILKRKAFKE